MATGISKNGWSNYSCVIPPEDYKGSTDFEITYPDKYSISQILQCRPKSHYKELYHSNTANQIYFGENFDVLSYLYHNLNYGGKINLV